jgi:predicted membrane GTPase involved in stress response
VRTFSVILFRSQGVRFIVELMEKQLKVVQTNSARINYNRGHADFAGEVEHLLNMVDGVSLVGDATEVL